MSRNAEVSALVREKSGRPVFRVPVQVILVVRDAVVMVMVDPPFGPGSGMIVRFLVG